MKAQDSIMLPFLLLLTALCLGFGATAIADEAESPNCIQDYFVDQDYQIYQESPCQGALPFVNIGKNECQLLFLPCQSGDPLPQNIVDGDAPRCPAGEYFSKENSSPQAVVFGYAGCKFPRLQIWKFDFGDSEDPTLGGDPPELGNGPGTTPDDDKDKDKDKDEHPKKGEGGVDP